MTVANITAKRVSDNVVFQATGDTPFNFTGLGSGVEYDLIMPDGTVLRRTTLAAANLTRIANTQVISVDTNLATYTSAGDFTANASTDFILGIVTLANRTVGPDTCTLELGSSAFTLASDQIPTLGTIGNALAVFYLPSADIPSGANAVAVSFFNDVTSQPARSVQVELIEFSGVDQSNPLYFGTATDNVITIGADILSDVTISAAADHHISVYTVRNNSGVTPIPFTSDATIIRNSETGIRINESTATAITASAPGATGVSTHTTQHAVAGSQRVLELAIGVRAA